MNASWLGMLLSKRMKLSTLAAILLGIFIIALLFFDYFYFSDRPLQLIELPIFKKLAPDAPKFLANIDRYKEGSLKGPIAVAASEDGKVYVTDSGNSRVLVYNHKGEPLFEFGKFGTKDGEMDYPYSIAVDNSQKVYVGQFKNPRIQVFDAKGTFLYRIDQAVCGTIVAPLALAIDQQGTIFVANQDSRILVLNPEGKLIKSFAGTGAIAGRLSYPKGIAVDNENIYVSDTNNMRIQIFSKDGLNLRTMERTELKVSMPSGIAVSQSGKVYVVDTFSNQIKVYDKDFKFLYEFAQKGNDDGQVSFPVGISLDQYGKVFIADTSNDRIVVFQR